MDQPDVTHESAGSAHLQEHRSGKHKRGGGRMIIVCTGGSNARQLSSTLFIIEVFHVGSVIVIGHDHGPSMVLSRNHDQEIALLGLARLIVEPSPHPGKVKIGAPFKRELARTSLTPHAVSGDDLPIVRKDPISEGLQITAPVFARCS